MAKSPGVRQTRPSLHKKAYVFRVAPGRIDRLEEALNCNEIIIGWGAAPDLTDASLSLDDFREAIKIAHYGDDVTYRRAGQAARHMWRFIREMADGHLVVVPHGQRLYVAQINRPAYYGVSAPGDLAE